MSRGTPWAWVKMAASLEGRSALHNGVSQWITGEAARADGHAWRARSCVVLTGIGTVLKDNPRLNVRAIDTPRPPRKAVVAGRFALPDDAPLFECSASIIFTRRPDPARAAPLGAPNATVGEIPRP